MSWYQNIKAILKDEPELWLSYIHGQQLENMPNLTESKPRYRGLPLQLLKFSYTLVRTWRPFTSYELDEHESYFFFAGTSNQIDSLNSTIDALKSKEISVTAIATRSLLNKQERKKYYFPLAFSSIDIFRAIVLLMVRGPSLYQELKSLHPQAVNLWFADFCLIYIYLVYFYRVLSKLQPNFVITANDHSVPNRCMLAVAHQLCIKTVYLQHASVSSFFPALRMSYAFLDGQCALDTYLQCEKNQPKTDRIVPVPKIFLSGQKKPIIKNNKKGIEAIGVALNSLDDINIAISLINQLANMDYRLVVRWHPGQAEREVRMYREEFAGNSRITLSEPKSEKVSDFLSQINSLIAGNSSIHLEAALAGITSMYYELGPTSTPDYYGYVRNGLAIKVSSAKEVCSLIKNGFGTSSDSMEFIRYYSSTYQTDWEGLEGRLVAEILECTSNGTRKPIDPLNYFDLI